MIYFKTFNTQSYIRIWTVVLFAVDDGITSKKRLSVKCSGDDGSKGRPEVCWNLPYV